MNLYWGVQSFLVPIACTVEDMLKIVEQNILANTDIKPGHQVVVITGFPIGDFRTPNLALLYTVGGA